HSFSCERACSAASAAMALCKIRFIEEKICCIRGRIPTRDRDWCTTSRCGKGKVLSRSCNNRGCTTEARTYIYMHHARIHCTPSVKVIRHRDFASASTATGCAAREKLIPHLTCTFSNPRWPSPKFDGHYFFQCVRRLATYTSLIHGLNRTCYTATTGSSTAAAFAALSARTKAAFLSRTESFNHRRSSLLTSLCVYTNFSWGPFSVDLIIFEAWHIFGRTRARKMNCSSIAGAAIHVAVLPPLLYAGARDSLKIHNNFAAATNLCVYVHNGRKQARGVGGGGGCGDARKRLDFPKRNCLGRRQAPNVLRDIHVSLPQTHTHTHTRARTHLTRCKQYLCGLRPNQTTAATTTTTLGVCALTCVYVYARDPFSMLPRGRYRGVLLAQRIAVVTFCSGFTRSSKLEREGVANLRPNFRRNSEHEWLQEARFCVSTQIEHFGNVTTQRVRRVEIKKFEPQCARARRLAHERIVRDKEKGPCAATKGTVLPVVAAIAKVPTNRLVRLWGQKNDLIYWNSTAQGGPLDQTKHRELQYWVPGDPKKILEQIHDPDLKSSPSVALLGCAQANSCSRYYVLPLSDLYLVVTVLVQMYSIINTHELPVTCRTYIHVPHLDLHQTLHQAQQRSISPQQQQRRRRWQQRRVLGTRRTRTIEKMCIAMTGRCSRTEKERDATARGARSAAAATAAALLLAFVSNSPLYLRADTEGVLERVYDSSEIYQSCLRDIRGALARHAQERKKKDDEERGNISFGAPEVGLYIRCIIYIEMMLLLQRNSKTRLRLSRLGTMHAQ
ncbi:unnamed protein product, partial [Trichogramma brassicae]